MFWLLSTLLYVIVATLLALVLAALLARNVLQPLTDDSTVDPTTTQVDWDDQDHTGMGMKNAPNVELVPWSSSTQSSASLALLRTVSWLLGALDSAYSLFAHGRGRRSGTTLHRGDWGVFRKGWGKELEPFVEKLELRLPATLDVEETLLALAWPETLEAGVPKPRAQSDKPMEVQGWEWTMEWKLVRGEAGVVYRDAMFVSPVARRLPTESKRAYVRVVVPLQGEQGVDGQAELGDVMPRDMRVVVHTAATGDQGFGLRTKRLAVPLAKQHRTASVVLGIAFYGKRKPEGQNGYQLDHVMDIEKQGHAVIEESRALLRWLHEQGYARVGVAGISFGGAMAALTGRNMPFPLAMCSFVGSHSPEPAYLDGVMSRSVNMDALTSPKHGHIAASAILRHFLASFDVRDVPVSGVPAAFVQINAIHDRFLHASSAAVLHSAFAQHAHFRTRMYWIAGGHLSAIVLHSGVFIKGIIESFDLLDELL